jgi:hypothetical protein
MSYVFLLRPKETGNLTVPGAKAMIDGKQYSSKSMAVQVTSNDRNMHHLPISSYPFCPHQFFHSRMIFMKKMTPSF